jgi:hypothetical protein
MPGGWTPGLPRECYQLGTQFAKPGRRKGPWIDSPNAQSHSCQTIQHDSDVNEHERTLFVRNLKNKKSMRRTIPARSWNTPRSLQPEPRERREGPWMDPINMGI